MNLKSKGAFIAVLCAIAFGSASMSSAATRIVEKTTSSGKALLIFTWFDCSKHSPFEGTAFVEHGTLNYIEKVESRCGRADERVRQVWYTSNPGFVGNDVVTVPQGIEIRITVH